ncbi:bestrophin family protein [Flavobacterium silvaticum]|uniref:Multidrug transporter n=1 Tax=Flavobacterium silvaticum TaxID=1852020 RepID=A0A972JJ79_9FLAO|nr:bestrophin family ion channel [Flavobacterium silvaticum]NMH29083.1 multidrug transporter [Flavobacterium silvaticum]
MHTGKQYRLLEFLMWTRRDIYVVLILSIIPTVIYEVFHFKWVALPWVPIAMVGTAAAFIIGFKNTQTYNRLWEARQIWGAIVNQSRSFGMMTRDFVDADAETIRQIIYRHFAWLTALRFQLREKRAWENSDKPHFKEYRKIYRVPEWEDKLEDELSLYVSDEELKKVLTHKNRATQLIALQSAQFKKLKGEGKISGLEYIELELMLSNLYEQQGKCERIKNFPYPRQFASLTLFFVWLFVGLLPFGMLNEFAKLGEIYVWYTIPFSVFVGWIFTTMDKVGEATENPFEGGANDIPMASMSRTIEIDMREMIGETELPAGIAAVNKILM